MRQLTPKELDLGWSVSSEKHEEPCAPAVNTVLALFTQTGFPFLSCQSGTGAGTFYCTFTLKEKDTQFPLTKLKDSAINPAATLLPSPFALLLKAVFYPSILSTNWQAPCHLLCLFTLLSCSSWAWSWVPRQYPGTVTHSWAHSQIDEQWEMGTDISVLMGPWGGFGSPWRHDFPTLHPRESPGFWATATIFWLLTAAVKGLEKLPLSLLVLQHQPFEHPLAVALPWRTVLLFCEALLTAGPQK